METLYFLFVYILKIFFFSALKDRFFLRVLAEYLDLYSVFSLCLNFLYFFLFLIVKNAHSSVFQLPVDELRLGAAAQPTATGKKIILE